MGMCPERERMTETSENHHEQGKRRSVIVWENDNQARTRACMNGSWRQLKLRATDARNAACKIAKLARRMGFNSEITISESCVHAVLVPAAP